MSGIVKVRVQTEICVFFAEEGSSSKENRVEDDNEQEDKTNCTKRDAEQDKITASRSCSGLLVRGTSTLLLHKEKHLKYMLNLIMTVSFDMVSTVYASL